MKFRLMAAAAAIAFAPVCAAAAAPAVAAAHAPVRASAPAATGPRAACPSARPGYIRCFALFEAQVPVNEAIAARAAGRHVPAAPGKVAGWGPKDIASAYHLPVGHDPHQTVAVVDAQSTPNLAADLADYRQHYGLPPCTTASGCLRIVNQQGKASPLPAPDPTGWGVEETLDVSMVSAACPYCKILLVEANSAAGGSLAAAEDTAARLGAQVISNSYGARESGADQPWNSAYDHLRHTIVVSSGDDGFTAANFPANLATVTAVGGTQLARAHNARGWSEKVWRNNFGAGGSGCSAYVTKPSWQHDTHCPGRTTTDVSAVGWNLSIYDSSLTPPNGPWLTVGGTSASAPLIAGIYALAGNATTIAPRHLYQHHSAFYDITTGSNALLGSSQNLCGNDYLCVGKPGYDAPTGLGTPHGTGAF